MPSDAGRVRDARRGSRALRSSPPRGSRPRGAPNASISPRRYGFWSYETLHHPDVDLEPEDRARERERRAPLARAGLGRQALHALLLVVVRLRDRGVRLVRAGRRDALVLVVDARGCLERALQAARAIERRRPPLAIDAAHLLRDRDEPIGRDLLADDRHREERREVVGADGLARARVEHGRRRLREIGRDVVPGLRKPALVEDVLHLVGHLALLSLGRRRSRESRQSGPTPHSPLRCRETASVRSS